MLLDIYKDDSSYSKYKIEEYYKKDYSGALVSADYKDFYSYTRENKIKKTLFGQIELYEENGHGFFKAYDYRGELFFSSEETDFKNNSLVFTLKLPFKVIGSNADSIDVENGVYSWTFDENSVDKDVNIEFDLSKIAVKNKLFQKSILVSAISFSFILVFIVFVYFRYK